MIISISGASNSGKTYLINSLQKKEQFKNIFYFPSNSSLIFKALEQMQLSEKALSKDTLQRLICDVMVDKLNSISEQMQPSDIAVCDRSIYDNYLFTKYLYKKAEISKETYYYVFNAFKTYISRFKVVLVLSNEKIEIESNGYREKTVGVDPEFNKFFIKQSLKLKKEYPNIEVIKTADNRRRIKKLKEILK